MRVAPQSWKEVVVYLEIRIVLLLFGTCNVMRAMGSGSGCRFFNEEACRSVAYAKRGAGEGGFSFSLEISRNLRAGWERGKGLYEVNDKTNPSKQMSDEGQADA